MSWPCSQKWKTLPSGFHCLWNAKDLAKEFVGTCLSLPLGAQCSTDLFIPMSTERLKHSAERTFPASTLASSIIAKTHQDPNVSLGLGQSLKGSKYNMLQHRQSPVSPTFSSNVQASIKAGWYDTLAPCTTTSCLTYVVKLMTWKHQSRGNRRGALHLNPSSISAFSPHFSDQWVGRCENEWVQHPAAQGSTTELK